MKSNLCTYSSAQLLIHYLCLFQAFSCTINLKPDQVTRWPERPNILWISFEDSGPHLKPFGDPTAPTPVIDRLAGEGIVYTNTYSISGVCSPSRSALITGMYPASIGAHNHRSIIKMNENIGAYVSVPPPEVKCFSEYLRQNGYYCTNNMKCDYNFGSGINKPPSSAWNESGWSAHWRNRPPEKPFFSVFNYGGTHMFQLWKREGEALRIDPDKVPVPPIYKDTPIIRKSIALYYDNLINFDAWAGNLITQLEDDGLLEKTVIFMFSDHGWAMPRGKIWMYDAGIQAPLIIRLPNGMNAGSIDDQLVSFIDFAPTVLSLSGTMIPRHIQGRAFLGPDISTPEREYVFAAKDRIDYHVDMIRAVRSKEFKYIRNYQPDNPYLQYFPWLDSIPLMQEMRRLFSENQLNDAQKLLFQNERPPEELYDVVNDPWEIQNLADNPSYNKTLRGMRAVNTDHLIAINDRGFRPESALREEMWPGGQQPKTNMPNYSFKDGHDSGEVLELSCETDGASIIYSSGKDDSNWHLYHDPILVEANTKVKAIGVRYGYKNSDSLTILIE